MPSHLATRAMSQFTANELRDASGRETAERPHPFRERHPGDTHVPRGAGQLASLMGHVNGNLAGEVGRLHEWEEKIR